jgi:hypothetical protein
VSTGTETERLTFQREQVADCFEEAQPLLEAHWREVAHFKDIDLDPDWDAYRLADEHGFLRTFTVRNDGALKGYAVFFVKGNLHYRQSVQAQQDILFLAPELRGPMLGLHFIRWCDEQLATEGVQAVYHHVKTAKDFGPILKHLGYEPVETIWARRLDRG